MVAVKHAELPVKHVVNILLVGKHVTGVIDDKQLSELWFA